LVATAHYILHRNTAMLGPTCYLQDLLTREEARGRGGGKALMLGAHARAKRRRELRPWAEARNE